MSDGPGTQSTLFGGSRDQKLTVSASVGRPHSGFVSLVWADSGDLLIIAGLAQAHYLRIHVQIAVCQRLRQAFPLGLRRKEGFWCNFLGRWDSLGCGSSGLRRPNTATAQHEAQHEAPRGQDLLVEPEPLERGHRRQWSRKRISLPWYRFAMYFCRRSSRVVCKIESCSASRPSR